MQFGMPLCTLSHDKDIYSMFSKTYYRLVNKECLLIIIKEITLTTTSVAFEEPSRQEDGTSGEGVPDETSKEVIGSTQKVT